MSINLGLLATGCYKSGCAYSVDGDMR